MTSFLRGLALLALMLPALLLPRGVTLTACLCGDGFDTAVCMVTCAEDARPECCCGGSTCAAESQPSDSARGSNTSLPSLDTDHRCPHCHLLKVEHAGTDFVGDAAEAMVDSGPALAHCAPNAMRWSSAVQGCAIVGRAPPGWVPCPGARPGDLPLRI